MGLLDDLTSPSKELYAVQDPPVVGGSCFAPSAASICKPGYLRAFLINLTPPSKT